MATRLVFAGREEKHNHCTLVCMSTIYIVHVVQSMQLHFKKLYYVDVLTKVSYSNNAVR